MWPAALRRLIMIVLCAISAAPVLSIDIPAMVDYPNHLARMHLIAEGLGGVLANPFYELDWGIYPNLAMDILVPLLARVMGVELATKLFYMSALVLIATGAMAIEYRVKRAVRASLLAFLVLLYCHPFTVGLLNFQFGLGLALWSFAAWLCLEDRPSWLRLLVHSLAVFVLSFAHFFALGIYGITIGLYEIGHLDRKRLAGAPLTFVIMAAPAAVVLLYMIVMGGQIGDAAVNQWDLPTTAAALLHFFSGYHLALSIAAFELLCILLVVYGRHLSIARPGACLAAGFAATAVLMPIRLFDTAVTSSRVLVAAGLIVPSFISTDRRTAWRFSVFAAAIALLNALDVGYLWRSYASSYSDINSSFRELTKEARVLVATNGPISASGDFPMLHAPTLAVHYANAFVPTFFAAPGKQPIAARPQFQHLVAPQHASALPDLAVLCNDGAPGAPHFLSNWQRDFDYVYVLGPKMRDPSPSLLTKVAVGDGFSLYRIEKQKSPKCVD
jgi:hypothetical protein